MEEIEDEGVDLLDASEVPQVVWGGVGAHRFDTYEEVLRKTVKQAMFDLQLPTNIAHATIPGFGLLRLFGMWSSCAFIKNGGRLTGEHTTEAEQQSTRICEVLAAILALCYAWHMYFQVVALYIASTEGVRK